MAWNYFSGFDPKITPFSPAEFNKKKRICANIFPETQCFKKKYVKLNNSLKNLLAKFNSFKIFN